MERVKNQLTEMPRAGDLLRRIQRCADGPMTRRKLVLLVLSAVFIILYIGPVFSSWLFGSGSTLLIANQNVCHRTFLSPFQSGLDDYDVYIRRENSASHSPKSHNYIPYVGNGFLGLSLEYDSHIYIKYGRVLSIAIPFSPLYIIEDYEIKEFSVAEYKKGIVHRFQCSSSGIQASYQYYAHRTIPSLFVQQIWISNPTDSPKSINLKTAKVTDVQTFSEIVKLHQGVETNEYIVMTSMVPVPDSEEIIAVAVVTRKLSNTLTVDSRDGHDLIVLTTVQYSKPIKKADYSTEIKLVKKNALSEMEKAIALTQDRTSVNQLKENHARVWESLWYTGFYISDSKAEGSINGDRINATIYAILSQVRSFEHEENIKSTKKSEILRTLTYSEGCYKDYSTLDAYNLWKPLNTIDNLISVASIWLLTLEKQGCHNLIKAGASGVNQAMILSFGSLRFSDQHLEFNMEPSKLHRDFLFRRLNYGNMTHVNISVIVQEDNKAAIFVALDRSDRNYYACDAGCLDTPVQLGPYRKYFPVKLTNPLKAILYVTADKQHMEDLRHAMHLKEVVEAPAHEHHIIALHKYGHSLGGLNPLFWISVIAIVVVFHLFLCRLIMNEFCSNNTTNYRRLYNRP